MAKVQIKSEKATPFGGIFHLRACWLSHSLVASGSRLPVSVYLIEHPKGLILVDTGWHRDMSPEGVYDKTAQIKSLGSRVLYNVNQGQIPLGEAVDERLEAMGIKPSDLDYVLLTHLDCDHANGLRARKQMPQNTRTKPRLAKCKSGL